MTTVAAVELGGLGAEDSAPATSSGFGRALRAVEDSALGAALLAMLIVPVLEMLLRRTLGTGIPAAGTIVQHLTLVVGTLGAGLAARENRMLTLSTADLLLKGRFRAVARVFANGFAAALAIYLAAGAGRFTAVTLSSGKALTPGVPLWPIQALIPLAFLLVAVRLVRHAGPTWRSRAAAVVVAVVFAVVGAFPPAEPQFLVLPALIVLALATFLGAPVFVTMGGAALILFWGDGIPIGSIAVDHYSLVTNATLATVPLFTLAGYLLAESGASRRLVRVFRALVGRVRGGAAVVTVLVCAFFTSFTGGSGVTILALGGLLMAMLDEAGYSRKASLGLLTSAGSVGLLFPPCLPIILYAILAGIRIESLFLGAFVPGLVMLVVLGWWGARQDRVPASERPAFDAREAGRAIRDAKWELLLPAVALVALFGGFATPVEAAAISAAYALFVESVLHRDLTFRRSARCGKRRAVSVWPVLTECGLVVGGVLLILGVALGFTNYLVDAEVPARAVDWVTGTVRSPLVFLLLLNVFLIVVGAIMDIFSALLVVVPLLVPLGLAYGIDPVHLGVIFLANLELGYLTPPMGENVFLASFRFGRPVPEVSRAILVPLAVMLVGVLVITYVPALTTTLPRWMGR